ncbi:MAG TPA: helix-turn-helix transcriptional regulator [Verrucomicrobiae bacterium]|nr:helix-turn-helix transcriptional regulator [Verrucomicrobiae bacterium]
MLRAGRVTPPPWLNQPEILSQVLREYRLKNHLSQKSLASRLGVTLSAVSRWERGIATPKPQSWVALQSLANWVHNESAEGSAPPSKLPSRCLRSPCGLGS